MKRIIKSEKFLYIMIAVIFLGAFTAVYLKTAKKLDALESVAPVVIHDVTFEEDKEEASKKVFVTPSGKKYHLDGCKFLREKRFDVTQKEAENLGYEACSYCQP